MNSQFPIQYFKSYEQSWKPNLFHHRNIYRYTDSLLLQSRTKIFFEQRLKLFIRLWNLDGRETIVERSISIHHVSIHIALLVPRFTRSPEKNRQKILTVQKRKRTCHRTWSAKLWAPVCAQTIVKFARGSSYTSTRDKCPPTNRGEAVHTTNRQLSCLHRADGC